MHTLIVYESSYGNTHAIADAISEGFGADTEVMVVPVGRATAELVNWADLLVVGGPTHAHGMSRPQTRQAAVDVTHQPESLLTADPDAEGTGLREWFDSIGSGTTAAAAFDTRVAAPALITGRASKGISQRLRHHGFTEIADPASFLVTKENALVAGQQDAARLWGALLAGRLTDAAPHPSDPVD